ncbi:MAG: radical SAM protein [Candidatus Latescibacteria bacterium]|nr:radical SAM protein [Candidatus Latescibacterota bacterium]
MKSLRDEVNLKYFRAQIIQTVLFEVTHRCPSDCIHCLLLKTPKDELTLDEIENLFHQLRDEGTVNIGLSGGEPFMRKDFPEILELAARDNFFLTLVTTGTMINHHEVNLLLKSRVRNVEISLLGANSATHDTIMRFSGAFNRMIKAVNLLRDNGIGVLLKTTVLRQNKQELPAMAKLAHELKVGFQSNISVLPQENGDCTIQELALSEDEVAGLDPSLVYGGLIPGENLKDGAILACTAGITNAGISPQGDIFPCIILRYKIGNIRNRTLKDIWHDNPDPFLSRLREFQEEDAAECFNCKLKPFCRRCPGSVYLETGDIGKPSPASCVLAKGLMRAYNAYQRRCP